VDGTGFYAFIDLPPGAYTVTASKAGYADAQTNVTIALGQVTGNMFERNLLLFTNVPPAAPTLLTEPADQVVCPGQTVTLSVLAGGSPTPAYQWQFNGHDLPGETAAQLVRTNVQISQGGGYCVRVTNVHGAVTSRLAILTVAPACAPVGASPWWSLAPGSRPYLTTNSLPYERGLACSPVSRRLLVVSRNGPHVYALDADTGADLHELNVSGISGGTYPLLMIGAADDGAVYAGNLTTAGTTTAFRLYRWANDDSNTVPTLAYSGDPGAGNNQRWGDTLDVRGAGTNTQILIASRSGNVVALFTTTNGTTFTPRLITVADAPTGAFGLGIAFGAGNTFWGKATSQNLRQVAFDLVAGSGTTIRNHGSPGFPANIAPIGVSVPLNLLGGIVVGTTGNEFRLYDLTPTNGTPVALATNAFATDNDNSQTGTGAVEFHGDRVYALGANNGLLALQIGAVPPAVVAPDIVVPPVSQTLPAGQAATFAVIATGTPLAYQWRFQAVPLPGATHRTFTTNAVQLASAGAYSVQVSNSAGSVTSSDAWLTVRPRQPVRIEQARRLPDGRFQLGWRGEAGWSYGVEADSNVTFPSPALLGPVHGSNGWFEFVDGDAANAPHRVYRTRE